MRKVDAKVTVTVSISECLGFSGANHDAVAQDVTFDETLAKYNGVECYVPPAEADPTTTEEIIDSPSMSEDDLELSSFDDDEKSSDDDVNEVDSDQNINDASPEKPGLADGEIAAIVVVVLVLVTTAVVLLVFFLWKRKQEKSSISPETAAEPQETIFSTS